MEVDDNIRTSPTQPLDIAQLHVVRTLGEGSFGEVKLLIDKNDSNVAVAVKIVDLKNHEKQAEAVRREALLQRILRYHVNVLKYVSMRVNCDDQFQLFLEYADGGELFDRIEPDVGMDAEKAKFYFSQLIDGLEYIHSNGIVHRDIKPENLLLTKNDVLKISDFGMATIFRNKGRERYLDTKCGTMPYVAPEVLAGKYLGQPVDIWSAGVVLVTMLVGELPWESPERCTIRFKCWADGKAMNKRPWNKIDVIPLALIKRVLDPDPSTRATIAQIYRESWLQYNEMEMEVDYGASLAKRQRLIACAAFSQPAELLSMTCKGLHRSGSNELTDSHIQLGGLPATSFSQPEVIDFLTKSQVDSTQTVQIHPLQKLARRMTRFCVSISQQEAVVSISRICSANGFQVRTQIPQQLVAVSIGRDKHELALVVTIFGMVEDGKRKVLADFRRSKGDGIEFKRIFLIVRKEMENVICKESYDWLIKQGLMCSSEGIKSRISRISPNLSPPILNNDENMA